EQRRLDHAGRPGSRVAVVVENVPSAEHEIVEARERNDLADFWRTPFRPFSQTDGTHLGQRTDRRGDSLADGEDSGNRRGADGAEADEQDAKFSACRGDISR